MKLLQKERVVGLMFGGSFFFLFLKHSFQLAMSLLLGAKSSAFSMQKHRYYIVMAQCLCCSLIAGSSLLHQNCLARTLNKGTIGRQRKRLYSLKAVKSFTYWYLRDSDMLRKNLLFNLNCLVNSYFKGSVFGLYNINSTLKLCL